MHYEQRHGDYVLLSDTGDILLSTPQVALCFDAQSDPPVLLKHGTPERIEAHAAALRKRLLDAGPEDFAAGISVLTGAFAVEDLNRMIDTIGYLKSFLKRLGFSLVVPHD